MDAVSLWQFVVDQGLLWLLVPFALVVWWGFSPSRRNRRSGGEGPGNGPVS